MATLTTLAPTVTVDDVVEVIDRDGGVIIEDFVDDETLAGLWSDLGPHLDRQSYGTEGFAGFATRRLGGLFGLTEHCVPLVRHPLYVGAADHYLKRPTHVWIGDDRVEVVPNYQIGVTQVIQLHPGQGAQGLHRDDMVFQWRHPTFGREARVQIMLAMSDFTAENGGTLTIAGSHRWDDERQPHIDEAENTVMRAGSVCVFVGSTYHGGGTNRSDSPRTGLTITLDLGMLRQEENQYLAVPVDVVRRYPEDIQRLLGYTPCPPFMGYIIEDGQFTDPNILVSGVRGAHVTDMYSTL